MCWSHRRAGQHDLGALDDQVGQRAGVGDALQLLNFALREDQRCYRTADTNGRTASGNTQYSIAYLRDCTLALLFS